VWKAEAHLLNHQLPLPVFEGTQAHDGEGYPSYYRGVSQERELPELSAQAHGGVQETGGKQQGVLDHLMLDGVASRRSSRGDAELAIDRSQVPVDRARADDELLGDLCIGQTSSNET
jgi:hypothetical protein